VQAQRVPYACSSGAVRAVLFLPLVWTAVVLGPWPLVSQLSFWGTALVLQVNVEAMEDGPENPYGNGFEVSETDLLSEAEAQRVQNPASARYWKIKNPNSRHPITGGAHFRCPALAGIVPLFLEQRPSRQMTTSFVWRTRPPPLSVRPYWSEGWGPI
jgi:Copper amine oxidase, enzyme domain